MDARRFRRSDTTKWGSRTRKPGVMNGTEAAYAETLQARKLAGEIIAWGYERFTFKLADGCRYTPDFDVWLTDGTMEFVDTKGGPQDDKSRVKLKVAAELFPQFVFVIEAKVPKKYGGGWRREVF